MTGHSLTRWAGLDRSDLIFFIHTGTQEHSMFDWPEQIQTSPTKMSSTARCKIMPLPRIFGSFTATKTRAGLAAVQHSTKDSVGRCS
jgi:hypothetical protein